MDRGGVAILRVGLQTGTPHSFPIHVQWLLCPSLMCRSTPDPHVISQGDLHECAFSEFIPLCPHLVPLFLIHLYVTLASRSRCIKPSFCLLASVYRGACTTVYGEFIPSALAFHFLISLCNVGLPFWMNQAFVHPLHPCIEATHTAVLAVSLLPPALASPSLISLCVCVGPPFWM